ncbi:unnamed protein product, partial [Rotaria sp. Silwood1]
MHWIFASLSCIIFAISIHGTTVKRQAFINKDAIQMAGLVEKCWSLKPDGLSKKGPLAYCNVIEKCCSNEHRSQAISISASILKLNDDDAALSEFIDTKCINSTTFDNENQWCSSFRLLVNDNILSERDVEDPDVEKYRTELQKYAQEASELLENALSTCTGEELYSFMCLSNKNLMKTCAGKLLQKLYDYNGYK